MWTDTHCHLDASEFGSDSGAIAVRAKTAGVDWIVLPAVAPANFDAVRDLAQAQSNCVYALGIHPICVPEAVEADLDTLRASVSVASTDPRFIAIGEIGLDFFLPALCTPQMREKQAYFYAEQLKIARDFDLPVLLHVRRSQDLILKYLRRIRPVRGIAHAFNGSLQQAHAFIDLGFKLGFGGAMTFTRALQIRRLASNLPLDTLVLETDAPDIAPAWIHPARNSPENLTGIGAVLAELRGLDLATIASATTVNARAALPRLARLAESSARR